MNKECPHCHEKSFGWRELLTLDYFSSDECKACGKQVRNDGFRQFLIVPTILTTIFFGVVLFSIMPGSFQPLGFLFIFILAGLSIIALAKPVKLESPEVIIPPFTPNPNNDKVIIVTGWNEEELHKILDDFGAEGSTNPPSRVEVHKHYDTYFRLTFPEDVSPSEFAALVNYLTYPLDFDLPRHS